MKKMERRRRRKMDIKNTAFLVSVDTDIAAVNENQSHLDQHDPPDISFVVQCYSRQCFDRR